MSTKPPQVMRKLPDFDTLTRLIEIDGLTHKEIAARYGVRDCNVRATLRRRAIALGRPYPVRNRQAVYAQVTARRNGTLYCNPVAMRSWLIEAERKVSRAEIARRAGVGHKTLYNIINGRWTQMSRETAARLEPVLAAITDEGSA